MTGHRGATIGLCRVAVVAAIVAAPLTVASADNGDTRAVSIMVGCLEVPTAARVVLTEDMPDAWVGYVELPGRSKKVWWTTGMWTNWLEASSGREILWTNKCDHSGNRFGMIRKGGIEFLVLSLSELVQFLVPGGSGDDLDLLRNVAAAHRTTPGLDCERPLFEARERAF